MNKLNSIGLSIPEKNFIVDIEHKVMFNPISFSPSKEGAIGDEIISPKYSEINNYTWKKLFYNQFNCIKNDVCDEFINGINLLNIDRKKIPKLSSVSKKLKSITNWEIMRVEGLVYPRYFFELLANKLFPCTDFIRDISELNYIRSPDIFHDQFGHLPLISDHKFANFFHLFGLAGTKAKNDEEIEWFNRIYWYTAEFGIMKNKIENSSKKIYGAGLISSKSEFMNFYSNNIEVFHLDIDYMAKNTIVDINDFQKYFFEIESFEELEYKFTNWATKNEFL
ncbi:phenylalanine 4-monooxygenase [Silvanigrella aquatica]|uniref:Biopterin-dependent aromatic amino acid hydroxylase family profile domain-containing protein n=1 Tax=Silvanigrella aquatica TaxID=1915309 RepID=A0A1L4CXU6_9BACT|nr:phenylalanine 4-monooxygenase [Silvanigrella aquatica]APJ02768.1 hypothetical protein AXG55_02040 [Silvanigrella aquatica]